MNIIRAIRNFQWSEAWAATKLFFMLVGGISLAIWLREPLPWWLVAASLFCVGMGWFLCFHIVCSWREHVVRRESERTNRAKRALPPPIMRRRFVCFDPESGEEVYKSEPVN